MKPATKTRLDFLGGFVSGEGYFGIHGNPPKFRFAIGLGAQDYDICIVFQETLGVGRVYWYERRKIHYDDEVSFVVQSLKELIYTIVPFMDDHLPASYKRVQYEAWRKELLNYWETRARKVQTCSIEGCKDFRKSHGVCRKHLWKVYRM